MQRGRLPDLQDGQAITQHVFGAQQSSAVNAVSQRAGISPQLAMQIISMVAPLVLGYLSRNKGGAGGSLGGLGGILGSVLGGGAAGGLGGLLGGILGGAQGQPSQYQQPQHQQPRSQPSSGSVGDLGGLLGSILGGGQQATQPGGPSGVGGVGLEPVNQPVNQRSNPGGNPLEDLIGMFGGQRR